MGDYSLFIHYSYDLQQQNQIKSNTMIKDNTADGQPGHKMALMAIHT